MQLAGAGRQLLWGRDAPTATCYKKWQKITLACRCFVILTPATPSSATSPHSPAHSRLSSTFSCPNSSPGPSATHSMHYLHLSELLRICRCTNESFGPWLVTDNWRRMSMRIMMMSTEQHEQQHKQMMQQMSFCLIFNGTQQERQQQQRGLLPANVTCRVIWIEDVVANVH